MTTSPVQKHVKPAQHLHNALAESQLLPEQRGLSDSNQRNNKEEGIVSVHDSVPLFNDFAVSKGLLESETSRSPMEVSKNSVQRKRRPTNGISLLDSTNATVERPFLSAKRVRTRPSQNTPASEATVPTPLTCYENVDTPDRFAETMKAVSSSETPLETAVYTFTLVSRRIGSKRGIPLVIRPKGIGDLRKTSPRQVYQEILHAIWDTSTWLKYTRSGSVRPEAAISCLLAARRFSNTEVDTQIPVAYMAISTLIRGIPPDYFYDELGDFPRDQRVIQGRRRHRRHPIQPDITLPTKNVLPYFAPNTKRTHMVGLCYWVDIPREHTTIPPRCYKCQRFGHDCRRCGATFQRCYLCWGSIARTQLASGARIVMLLTVPLIRDPSATKALFFFFIFIAFYVIIA